VTVKKPFCFLGLIGFCAELLIKRFLRERSFTQPFLRRTDLKMHSPRFSSQASIGLTLLELAVTVAVIAIAALGIVSYISTGYAVDREATETLAAQNLARRVMEELQEAPFTTLIENFDRTQIVEGDLRAVIRIDQIEPQVGAPSLVRLQVTVQRRVDNRLLFRLLSLRADHRSPASAWRTGS